MHKKLIIFLLFLQTFSSFSEMNNEFEVSSSHFEIRFTEFSYPLMPEASKVSVSIPFLSSSSAGKEITSEFWYLSASPLLSTIPFFEVGSLFEYQILKQENFALLIGIGSAFSKQNEDIAIPLITSIRSLWKIWSPIELDFQVENLLYGGGDMAVGTLNLNITPFRFGLLIAIGGTASFAYSWDLNMIGTSYGLSLGMGYQL